MFYDKHDTLLCRKHNIKRDFLQHTQCFRTNDCALRNVIGFHIPFFPNAFFRTELYIDCNNNDYINNY